MKYTVLCTVAAMAASAHAGNFFSESENNDTIAMANGLGTFDAPGGNLVLDGVMGTSDVDWFSFTLDNDASLSFFSIFSAAGADGLMQIVATGGDVIAFDDDSGVGLMPSIQIENLAAGTYYIGISGFGDVDSSSVGTDELADGRLDTGEGHGESFAYKLNVGFSIVPAPGATALLGMGGLMITRRRR